MRMLIIKNGLGNMTKKRGVVRLYLVLVVLLMVLPFGDVNINDTFVVGFRLDYIVHFVIYMPWMFLCGKRWSLLWLLCGVAVVIALECVQWFLPYRGFNINDIIAGVIGVVISFVVSSFVKSK